MKASWIERHLILSMFLLLTAVTFMAAFWELFLAAGIIGLTGWGLWEFTRYLDRQHAIKTRRRQMIIDRAEYEHRMWLMGDARGFYGRFPPGPL